MAKPGSRPRVRNDSALYTGGGSKTPVPSAAKQKTVDELNAERVARKDAKERFQKEHGREVIDFLALIDDEKKKTDLQLLKFISPAMPDIMSKDTISALNLYNTSMDALKVKLKNKLRLSTLEAEE